MPQNDDEYVPSSDFNEISDSYRQADVLMETFNSLISLTDADFTAILEEHDLQVFVKEHGKPVKHIFDRILESGKQQSKVA